MRIIFMGTPDFAVPSLEACIQSGHKPVLCVSQPDRPQGRKQVCIPTPVKQVAERAGIPVFQPTRVRDAHFLETLASYEPDLIVTAAYGRILTRAVLQLPRLGAINVHGSLLPRYRGASPVQTAIWNRDAQTGVTILEMTEELDAGRILLQRTLPLTGRETTDILMRKLADLGGEMLPEVIRGLEQDNLIPREQDPAFVVHTKLMTKQQGQIRWLDSAEQIDAIVRACTPWPGAWCLYEGKRVRLLETRVVSEEELQQQQKSLQAGEPLDSVSGVGSLFRPGLQIPSPRKCIWIQTGAGVLDLLALQKEGGKSLLASECAHSFPTGKQWESLSEESKP